MDLPLPTSITVQCILTGLDADKGMDSGIRSEITGVILIHLQGQI